MTYYLLKKSRVDHPVHFIELRKINVTRNILLSLLGKERFWFIILQQSKNYIKDIFCLKFSKISAINCVIFEFRKMKNVIQTVNFFFFDNHERLLISDFPFITWHWSNKTDNIKQGSVILSNYCQAEAQPQLQLCWAEIA